MMNIQTTENEQTINKHSYNKSFTGAQQDWEGKSKLCYKAQGGFVSETKQNTQHYDL